MIFASTISSSWLPGRFGIALQEVLGGLEDLAYYINPEPSDRYEYWKNTIDIPYPMRFYPDVCDGPCLVACANVSKMFGSMELLHNCLVLPIITDYLESNYSTTKDKSTAQRLLGGNGSSLDFQGVHYGTGRIWTDMTACLSGYLQAQNKSTPAKWTNDRDFWAMTNNTNIPNIVFPNICDTIRTSVFISYYIQLSIAVLAFFLLKIYSSWPYAVLLVTQGGSKRGLQRAERVQNWFRRHLAPFKTALVEFQKAQCYFMIAIQIAALIVLSQGLLAADNLEEVWLNMQLMNLISFNGILPIVFILLCLHSTRMKSWYIFVLSSITVSMSIATLVYASKQNLQENLGWTASPSSFPNCGTANPAAYCNSRWTDNVPTIDANVRFLVPSIVLLFILFLDQCGSFGYHRTQSWLWKLVGPSWKSFQRLSERYETLLRATYQHQRPVSHPANNQKVGLTGSSFWRHCRMGWWDLVHRWQQLKLPERIESSIRLRFTGHLEWLGLEAPHQGWKLFMGCVWHAIFGYGLYLMIEYLALLTTLFSDGVIDAHSWGFGQIVALSVWAPVILEYLYLEIRGMRKGSAYRIPSPYAVIHENSSLESGLQSQEPGVDAATSLKPDSDHFDASSGFENSRPFDSERYEDVPIIVPPEEASLSPERAMVLNNLPRRKPVGLAASMTPSRSTSASGVPLLAPVSPNVEIDDPGMT